MGALVTVYSRQLKVVGYGDTYTEKQVYSQLTKTFGMIKPDCYNQIGKIIDRICAEGLKITKLKMLKLPQGQVREFYREHHGKPFYEALVKHIASDAVVGLELVGEDSVRRWRTLMGPTNPHTARAEQPGTLRALYGREGPQNATHGSDSAESAQRELELFFSTPGSPALLNNCSCCVIKPHVLRHSGKIIDRVLEEGFEISAMQMFSLDKVSADEFLEIYKGVLPDYTEIIGEITAGPCIAMEIRQENAVEAFRECCGPLDPNVAKQLKPQSIRALFGKDIVENAVHCTDLPEDGVLESEYFFRILNK